MSLNVKRWIVAALSFLLLLSLLLVAYQETRRKHIEKLELPIITSDSRACWDCHKNNSPALVMEWEYSKHAKVGIGCVECHTAQKGDVDAWKHKGAYISVLVTPLDCAQCHEKQHEEFSTSNHARAGDILASLDNVLAEKAAGMPGNIADAVNGCWQCHGSMIKFIRDEDGKILRTGAEKQPVIDPDTWPNSGIGRMNPDGSKGSCHACHSRHAFQAKLSRSPENCGKCHMGPDHPQIEIYNESKHGIAFYANRDRMNLDKRGSWVLGRDYSAAPTCATCHISGYMSGQGFVVEGSHNVGERISWTLRPIVSTKLNLVVYEDGYKEDYPDTRELPEIGDEVITVENFKENETLVPREVQRTVEDVLTWEDKREKMIEVCLNCHNDTYVDNFYHQFDSLVELYNEKFAKPAKDFMDKLASDGVINPKAPFEKNVQWVFFELWHHEGRRARQGASMMGPDYTHWYGMYEVSKNYYMKFLPAVIKAAADKGPAMERKYRKLVAENLSRPENVWIKGLSPEEAEALDKMYKERYNE